MRLHRPLTPPPRSECEAISSHSTSGLPPAGTHEKELGHLLVTECELAGVSGVLGDLWQVLVLEKVKPLRDRPTGQGPG